MMRSVDEARPKENIAPVTREGSVQVGRREITNRRAEWTGYTSYDDDVTFKRQHPNTDFAGGPVWAPARGRASPGLRNGAWPRVFQFYKLHADKFAVPAVAVRN